MSWVKDPGALQVLRRSRQEARASLRSLLKKSHEASDSQRLELARAILKELRVVVKLDHALADLDQLNQLPYTEALLHLTEDWVFVRRGHGNQVP